MCAIFLLMAWATQIDKEFVPLPIIDFLLINTSDSCEIRDMQLIFRPRRDEVDTLMIPEVIPATDSLIFSDEKRRFFKIDYSCRCPGGFTAEFSQAAVTDTIFFLMLELGCD